MFLLFLRRWMKLFFANISSVSRSGIPKPKNVECVRLISYDFPTYKHLRDKQNYCPRDLFIYERRCFDCYIRWIYFRWIEVQSHWLRRFGTDVCASATFYQHVCSTRWSTKLVWLWTMWSSCSTGGAREALNHGYHRCGWGPTGFWFDEIYQGQFIRWPFVQSGINEKLIYTS